MNLRKQIEEQLPGWRARLKRLITDYGKVKVAEINIAQILGGIRDVKALVTDISCVDPNQGIRLRGYTIPELLELLPKRPGNEMPFLGGLYYLLLVGRMPTYEEGMEIEEEWKKRQTVPEYVYDVIRAMPKDTSAMNLFSLAILAMERESHFAREYDLGLRKEDYWIPTLEDALDLTARAPAVAAFIYNYKFRDGQIIKPKPDLDWAANFGYMIGIENKQYYDLARLYFLIHSDHESGNVSAHTTYLVSSTLSDVYYAVSAGLNGLAGPLHGRANQEAMEWLLEVYQKYQGLPTKEQLTEYAWQTLNAGKVIPGYGHAILRITDPRFTAQLEYGQRVMPDYDLFRLAKLVYEVVPEVLLQQGKAKDPWPNVDAISGVLQRYFGVLDSKENDRGGFYTVLFGVSRILGVTANTIWARALGAPIERPKSVTTRMLETLAEQQSGTAIPLHEAYAHERGCG
ncbi:MAG: citrate (Si)-synthase [Anaerolineae bacterium]|nr:MAG: citrate (Si)-synthase [Anaerolineae bacterium]